MHVPEPGDIYAFQSPTKAGSGKVYEVGDKLILLEMTGQDDPGGHTSSLGNWLVECRYYKPPASEAVWDSIWSMIERGTIAWTGQTIIEFPRARVIKRSK